jgi:capsular exopolysaccharide synthesis family protein
MDGRKQVVPEATLPERELTTRDEAYLGRTELDGSAALPPAPYSVDAAPNGECPNAEPKGATAPMELGVRDRQTNLFRPARRQPARDLVIGAGPPSEVYSAFSRLRNQIIKRLQENGWTTVAITSPSRASGTTLTAINLAISIARDFSYTVLLVELDLVNPSFRQVLGFKQPQGIVDHLLRDVPIAEILLDPGIDRLVVVPAGSPVTNSSELLASPKMTRLLEELKSRHEHKIVLFDLPAVLAIDDAMAFSPFVDCALLVVEEGETRVNDVRRALDQLKSTEILGVVLNRSFDVENDDKIISG